MASATKTMIVGAAVALALAAGPATAQPKSGAPLTAAEVNSLIVGHSVAATDGAMTWYYNKGGKYDADDGRNGRSGSYVVRPNGQLCWTETTGIAGCFQFTREGKGVRIRRVDAGHVGDIGTATIGPL